MSHTAADMGAVAIDGNDEEADEGQHKRGIRSWEVSEDRSKIDNLACNGSSTEPPRMAMIRPAAPNFGCIAQTIESDTVDCGEHQ